MTGPGNPVLGTFLAEMLDINTPHRGRSATPNARDDWSFTIDELLRITANRLFRHALTLGARRARAGIATPLHYFTESMLVPGQNVLSYALLENSTNVFFGQDLVWVTGGDRLDGDGADPPAPGDDGPEGPQGVSVLRIVTGPLEEPDR